MRLETRLARLEQKVGTTVFDLAKIIRESRYRFQENGFIHTWLDPNPDLQGSALGRRIYEARLRLRG
jgi:hypothetical protein